MNVLILGGDGRLGAALARSYEKDFRVRALGRLDADLSQLEKIEMIVNDSAADIVINCAAMTNVDACETNRELAERINATAPGIIAKVATTIGARLIQISTDYVFSGNTNRPYSENDIPQPISWYGATKKKGEDLVLSAGGDHAVVRVAWVFGPDRDSFLDKALQTACRGEQVSAVANKFSSPTYTADVAEALRFIFKKNASGGVYHVCNHGVCTWQDWAQYGIDSAVRRGAKIKPQSVKPLELTDIKAMVARRPIYSAMSCRKIESLTGVQIRDWQAAVDDYVGLLVSSGRI